MLIIGILLFGIKTNGQSTATPDCPLLPRDTLCGPDFGGYPISKPVEQFQNNLKWYIQSLQNRTAQLLFNDTCFPRVDEKVGDFRYLLTQQCVYGVYEALKKGCTSDKSKLQMCAQECQVGKQSLDNVLQDTRFCSKQAPPTGFDEICGQTTNSSNCIKTVPSEVYCGFNTRELAIQKCPSLPNDPCCQSDFLASEKSTSLVVILVSTAAGVLLLVAIIALLWIRNKKSKKVVDSINIFQNPFKSNQLQQAPITKFNNNNESLKIQPGNIVTKGFNPNNSLANQQPTLNTSSLVKSPTLQIASNLTKRTSSVISPHSSASNLGFDYLTLEVLKEYPPGTVIVKAIHPYSPQLNDELHFRIGQEFLLLKAFDDGWGLGYNHFTDKQGAFPLIYVVNKYGDNPVTSDQLKRRCSSMKIHNSFIETLKRPKVPFQDYLNQLND